MSTQDAEAIRRGFSEYLAGRLPGAKRLTVEVRGDRSAVGHSRENWPMRVAWEQEGIREERDLLLRRDPAGGATDTDRALEFQVLRALADTRYPAPRVHWLDTTGSFLGRPFLVMDRLQGSSVPALLDAEKALGLGATGPLRMAERLCDLLVELHRLDWRRLDLAPMVRPPDGPAAAAAIAEWRRSIDAQTLEPTPELELVFAWMERHLPRNSGRVVLLHGDYRPENVLWQGSDVAAILDWELSHLGDPLEDIAYQTVPMFAPLLRIPGTWEPEDFYRRYEEQSGWRIDRHAIRFWHVLTMTKVVTYTLTANRAFCEDRHTEARSAFFSRRILSLLMDLIDV